MAVSDIIQEQDDLRAHTQEVRLWPRAWERYEDAGPFAWTPLRLHGAETANVPTESGVYTLIIRPGIANHPACSYLMYVGQAESLRRRFRDYLTREKRETGRPKIFRLLNKYARYIWFCFASVPGEELEGVEAGLLMAYLPPSNDRFPAEVTRVVRAFS